MSEIESEVKQHAPPSTGSASIMRRTVNWDTCPLRPLDWRLRAPPPLARNWIGSIAGSCGEPPREKIRGSPSRPMEHQNFENSGPATQIRLTAVGSATTVVLPFGTCKKYGSQLRSGDTVLPSIIVL